MPSIDPRAFRFSFELGEMLSVFVFAAKRMVKGAATLTSFALGFTLPLSSALQSPGCY